MKKIYLLIVVCCIGITGFAQIPIAYWGMETAAAHNTVSLAVNDQITGTNGTAASAVTPVGVATTFIAGPGLTLHGGAAGAAISTTTAPNAANPGTGSVNYWQFSFTNTATAGAMTLTFDANTNGTLTDYGVLASTNGGISYTAVTTAVLTVGWATQTVALPAGTNIVRIYVYKTTALARTISIDNVCILASTTATGAVFTTANEADIYNMYTSGSAGQYPRTGFTVTGAGTNVTINNTSATSGVNVQAGNVFNVTSNATVTFGNTGLVNGGGIFQLGAGCTLSTANTAGITASTASLTGSVQTTTTRTFNAAANYIYNAAAAQVTGTGLPTPILTGGSVTVNNASGVTLTQSTTLNTGATLTLTNGNLVLGTSNLNLGTGATVAGTFSGTTKIVPVSTGQVQKQFAANTSYLYPVGDAANYSPVTLNFSAGTYAGGAYAAITLRKLKQPNNASAVNYINRYWSVSLSGITTPSYVVTATYVPGDVAGTETSISTGQYTGALPWLKYGATNAVTHTLTSASVSDATSDFTGISSAGPTVSSTASTAICSGSSVSLSATSPTGDPTLTYSWSPAAGLSSTAGTPVTATPTVTTTYILTITDGNGFTSTSSTTITVNPAPAALTGTTATPICTGGTISLGDATIGGVWSSSNASTAAVGTDGTVVGSAGGTATISYTLGGVCSATTIVTVFAPPLPITGSSIACYPGNITLSDASGAGTWTSSTPSIGTVGSTSGIVTGLATGTLTITYNNSAVCPPATYALTVNPAAGTITGGNVMCTGTILNLSDAPSGGTWSASSGIVSVNSSTGAVFASVAGTVTITYNASGCLATETVTVDAPPAAITGPTSVCTTGSITLSETSTGGTWSSSQPTVGSIGSTGIVSGLTAGSTTISYTTFAVCAPATYVVTVNPTPGGIIGGNTVCIGGILNLSNTVTGGTWTATSGIVTVNSSTGALLGTAAGSTTISYNASGCYASEVVTVDAPAASITGPTAVCTTGSITLADGTTGGTWSSSQPTVGSIGTTGIVSGLTAGTTTISYTTYAVCAPAMYVVTVNPTPGAITGGNQVCIGLILNLSDPLAGGTWSASNGNVSVNTTTGLVLGVSAGSTSITYNAAGCIATETVTVNTPPSAITGSATSVCVGNTISLSNTVPGGTWTSSAVGTATVSPSGIVTGLAAGTVTISYSTTSCNPAIYMITVNAYPAAITGPSAVCESASSTGTAIGLSDTSPGGVWTSSAPGIASVGSGSGFVTGGASGNATITYTLLGCPVYHPITVNPAPAAITGPTVVCSGSSITLADASAPGGTWSSSAIAVGSVGSSTGIVTGAAAGSTNISFTLNTTGCAHYVTVTVNPLPAAISGSNGVCYGYTTSLTDATPGGTWTSSVPTNAYVGTATGVVTGLLLGTTTISYTLLTSGCYVTLPMTVNPNPVAPIGPPVGCIGSTMLFTDGTPAGTWSTSSTALATAGTAGDITGVSAGTVTVSYTLGTGCFNTANMLVNTPPSPIVGDTTVCVTYHTQLMDSVSGGVWSSSALGSAFIDTTGNVLGIAPGTVNIFYAITGCSPAAFTITVNAIPAIITGTTYICDGVASQLYNDTLGGTWSSSDTSIVKLTPTTGFATGVSMGTAYVSYTLATGCYAAIEVTVNPLAPPIAGTDSVCLNGTTWLTDIVGGGTWTSSNSAVATISGTTGLLTPLTTGITFIVYTLPGGCSASLLETVFPPVQPMSAPNHICTGSSVLLTDAQTGGTWSSSNVFTASVDPTSGMLSAHYPDTVDITYTISAFRGCYFTKSIIVNPLPSPVITHNFGTHSLSTFNYYTTYQWYSDRHGLIPGATAATFPLPYANDSFYVVVTDTNGCSNSAGWYYYLYTGVSTVTAADISIYPNPATSMVFIESPVTVRAVITSIDGRKVMERADAKELDLSKLSEGVYLIALYDNDGKILTMQKLVKQ